jgi:hypothetical protein
MQFKYIANSCEILASLPMVEGGKNYCVAKRKMKIGKIGKFYA